MIFSVICFQKQFTLTRMALTEAQTRYKISIKVGAEQREAQHVRR